MDFDASNVDAIDALEDQPDDSFEGILCVPCLFFPKVVEADEGKEGERLIDILQVVQG